MYEGKFRDFMVGWLALQPEVPSTDLLEIIALYEAVVFSETDAEAFAEIKAVLGPWGAQLLWKLSHCWYDATVALAWEMIDDLRDWVEADTEDPSTFYLFFLNPFKNGSVPEFYEDNVERGICWMFRMFYETAGAAALDPKRWVPYVVVEPSWEDASNIIVLAHPREDSHAKQFVLQHWYKAWHLGFANLKELAAELLRLRQAIAHPGPTEFTTCLRKE